MMPRALAAACRNVESLSMLLALVDDVIVMADLQGRITGWSYGAEQLLGYAPAEILGRDCADIYAESEGAAHREKCRSVVFGAGPTSFDATLKTRAGEFHPARVELAPMFDADGGAATIFCNIRTSVETSARPDVSRSQVREFWALMDGAPLGLSHLDANRRFHYANRAAVAMAGADRSEVIGRHVRDVLGEAVYRQLLAALDSALTGSESVAEVSLSGRDGAPRHHLMHLVPRRRPDSAIDGCFIATVDITQAKLSQETQLRREHLLRATLVREINHRIKNSLQGVIGMMRLHAARRVPVPEVIDQGIAQLMAIAVAFGLASRHGEAQILLCDLVTDIAGNVEQITQRRVQVQLSPAAVRQPVALSESQSANISLIINELVFNAIKHSAGSDGRRGVRVFVDRDHDTATFRVINEAGQLPNGFSLQSGTGLGTGLNLIKVLVPPESCELSITAGPEGVCAQLQLKPPVLSPV